MRFPDNFTLEATFHSSETIQTLFDLLTKVIARPDLPFYLCEDTILLCISFSRDTLFLLVLSSQCGCIADTTPPKKQIKDFSQDFYSAGFVPGAIVYFAYGVPKGNILSAYSGLSKTLLSKIVL